MSVITNVPKWTWLFANSTMNPGLVDASLDLNSDMAAAVRLDGFQICLEKAILKVNYLHHAVNKNILLDSPRDRSSTHGVGV